jgi:hypothetical protein
MARNTSALPNSIEISGDENSSFTSVNLNSSPKSMKTENRTPLRQSFGTPKTPLSASVAASSPLSGSPASSASSARRTRRMWTESEEAMLISGVEKVRDFLDLYFLALILLCSTAKMLGIKFWRNFNSTIEIPVI